MKTILVTGGAGFIGSHLCDALIQRGENVIALDNFFSGSEENIKHLFSHERFTFEKHDITKPFSFFGKIDQVFNLACPASPVWYQKDPVETVRTNVLGTANMLLLAKEKKARILQASTSEVYGDPKEHPQKETYWGNVNPLGPRACYDEGKRCAETLVMDYHRQYDLSVKIVRIFNTYGPRMAVLDGRVVSNFIVQALEGKPITLYGSGSQTRSFQYITDLISGLIMMMERENFIGPVNVGNPVEFTISKLAELIMTITGTRSEIVFKPLPLDDPSQRQPDIAFAKKELGWSPQVPLEEGLPLTIEYFKNILGGAKSYSIEN